MANKVVTIAEPTADSDELVVVLSKQPGTPLVAQVSYCNQGHSDSAAVSASELTVAQRQALRDALTPLVNLAKVKMGF